METYKGQQISEFLSKVRALEKEYSLKIESNESKSFKLSYELGNSDIRVSIVRDKNDKITVDDTIDGFYCTCCGSDNVYWYNTLEDGTRIYKCDDCGDDMEIVDMINSKQNNTLFIVEKSNLTTMEEIFFLKSDFGHCYSKDSVIKLLESPINTKLIPYFNKALEMMNNKVEGFVYL